MQIKWDKDHCPVSLIKEIKSNLSLTTDGKVSYQIGIDFYFDALFGKVIHSYNLDYDVLYNEFTLSITDTFKANNLSKPNEILNNFKTRCDDILRNKDKYILVTSINLKNTYLPKRRKINDCTLSFSKDIPAKYMKARQKLLEEHAELSLSEQEEFLFVSISVQASNIKTAYMNAMGALDILRAVWQLGFRKNINFLAASKEHEYPTDSIISLGQMHSLHLDNGKEAWKRAWYEPRYQTTQPTTFKEFALAEANLDALLSKIRRSPFREHLNNSLISYINALDQNEQEFRFIKLWSALEKLVKTDDSKMLIKRVSFFYDKREETKEILESLRKARNINAHSGIKPFNVEMKNFQMCKYLDDLLRFFIHNPFKYKSIHKIIDFISLPTEHETIDEQISNLNMVKKFIGAK